MIQILIFILVIVFFALLLGFIARKRGADTFFWTLMGGLLGPFAVPLVFFAKTIDRKHPYLNHKKR